MLMAASLPDDFISAAYIIYIEIIDLEPATLYILLIHAQTKPEWRQ
jgi:general stress protein CsbA